MRHLIRSQKQIKLGTRDSEVANGSHMIGSVKDLWRQTQEMG